ncbi:carbohydrate kinase family protein [Kiloniella laminariae]|uniref:carbohydrate kinase family protein n=1 Tax=Kiloniella laminariae TaxID=454162 RepID=UPI000367F78B|nr:carbohydrate kinase [Kiloniella laminariae]
MIVCCGEALIDMLPRKIEDDRDAFIPVPGGAIYNTAVALGRLGEKAGFFSGISTDALGQQLVAHLEASGVHTAYCVRSPKATTLAVVTLADGHAQYSFYDENTAGRMLDVDALPNLSEAVQALHFGGISLIPEPCGSSYEELMRRAYEAVVISFDPNIRPGFVVDEAAYRARLCRMLAMSDIIKVSEEDLAWMEPGSHFEQSARNWIEGGAAIVTLTRGGGGARSITKTTDVEIAAKPVTVIDTVGAGDTFNAGFLASLRGRDLLTKEKIRTISSADLKAALEYGAGVAAYTVGQVGANPPWKHQII